MSTNSKKRKCGSRGLRVNKKSLGIRYVIQVYRGNQRPAIPHICLAEGLKNDLYECICDLQNKAKLSMEFYLPQIEYSPKAIKSTSDYSLFNVDPDEYSESNKPLRIIIGTEDIKINSKEKFDLTTFTFLTIVSEKKTPKFCENDNIKNLVDVALSEEDAIKYIQHLFLDITMANSQPINSIIRRFIKSHSHSEFFKKKVDFAQKKYMSKFCFGKIDNKIKYVSFASLCENCNGSINLNKYRDIWDSFMLEYFRDYFFQKDSIFKYINTKQGHEKQVNKAKLFRYLEKIKDEICVLILPLERPNLSKQFDEAISKYRFSAGCKEHWHREIGIIGWKEYLNNKHMLVNSSRIEPFKILRRLNSE